MKRTSAFGLGLASLLLTAPAFAGTTTGTTQGTTTPGTQGQAAQPQQGQTDSGQSAQGQASRVTGVVSKVDPASKQLTLIAPTGADIDKTRIGKTVLTDSTVSLSSLSARVGDQAPIMKNGNQATLSDIKEGDLVRANFDPKTNAFDGISAVSQQEIDRNQNQTPGTLLKELNQLNQQVPSGGNMKTPQQNQ